MELNDAQLHLVREWFDWMLDSNPAYLQARDYFLARAVYLALGRKVPQRVTDFLTNAAMQASGEDVEFHRWWMGAAHRAKYGTDHPAYLAAREVWLELKEK